MKTLRHKTGNNLFLLALLFVWIPGFAQVPSLQLKASSTTVAPQEPLTLTISSNVPGMITVDYPVEFISDYGTVDGMEQRLDASTGKIITSHYLQQSGRFGKTGKYRFRASIKYRGKQVYSNFVTVTVQPSAPVRSNSKVSMRNKEIVATLQLNKKTIYEGEAVLAVPKVYATLDLRRFDDYKVFKPDAVVESHEFGQVNFELHKSQIDGKNVNTFEYGKQLLFPVTVGTITFSPFEMVFEYQDNFFLKPVKVKSDPVSLIVKPLPVGAPGSFIGGVGKFSVSASLDKTSVKQGEVFTLQVTVSGVGNLQNIEAPKLNLPSGFQLYGDVTQEEELNYTTEGADGKMVFKIPIQVLKSGSLHFPAVEIAYFNPSSGKYEVATTESFSLASAADANFKQTTPASPVIRKFTRPQQKNIPWTLIGFITGVALVAVLGLVFIFKRKRTPEKRTTSAEAPIETVTKVKLNQDNLQPQETTPNVVSEPDFLAEAEGQVGNPDLFAISLPRAIDQKLRSLTGRTGRYECLAVLREQNNQFVDEVSGILESCDAYRYSFEKPEFDTIALLNRTKAILV